MATCPGTCIYSHLLQALAVLPPPKSVCPWIVLRYVSYLLRRWVYPYATLLASAAACLAAPLLHACCQHQSISCCMHVRCHARACSTTSEAPAVHIAAQQDAYALHVLQHSQLPAFVPVPGHQIARLRHYLRHSVVTAAQLSSAEHAIPASKLLAVYVFSVIVGGTLPDTLVVTRCAPQLFSSLL